jgi:hypothetical protein
LFGIVVMGTTLVLVCSFCGVNKIVSGWPFACYPTFSSPAGETLETLEVVAGTSSGETVPVEITAISPDRLYWVFAGILATEDSLLQQDRLRQLWIFAVQSNPMLKRATSVKFFRKTLWTNPELRRSSPGDRHLLFELDFEPCADLTGSEATPACPPSAPASRKPQKALEVLRAVEQ